MFITILRIQNLTCNNTKKGKRSKKEMKISRYTTLFIEPFQEDHDLIE
jgi:hypothetical protein